MEFLPLMFFALAVACLIGAIVVTVVPEQRAHQLIPEGNNFLFTLPSPGPATSPAPSPTP